MQAVAIDVSYNVSKTVCVLFLPKNRYPVINTVFPEMKIGDSCLQYVSKFRYLGHIIVNSFTDDKDILREIHSVIVHCNILARKFCRCSLNVKLTMFHCLCFYDIAVWCQFNLGKVQKF